METNASASNGAGLSIFNIAENAKELNQALYGNGGASPMFDIRVEEGKSTTFIIRVLPYVKDILQSKVQKFFYAVPNGTSFLLYDSRTTFNQPQIGKYEFCPISDIWLKLNANADPNVKKTAEQLRRQVSLVAYVQVVNCPVKPELNGKFMPMKLPIDLDKALRELAEPNDAQKALGKKPITAMDLFNGVNIECTITGHKQFGTVMRDWKITPDKDTSEIELPLGPNGAMAKVSTLSESAILAYFETNQSIVLSETYGYKQPSFDADVAAHKWLHSVCGWVPGMNVEIDNNFPHVMKFYQEQSIGGMGQGASAPIQTEQASYGSNQSAGNPMAVQESQGPQESQAPAENTATQESQAPAENTAPDGAGIVIP